MFYTNIARLGNAILLRGYDDNNKMFFKKIEDFDPKIYLPSKSGNSKFKTLDGKPLDPYQTGSISEISEFLNKFKKVNNFDYFGMENWIINFSVDYFPNKIEYDYNLIRWAFFDIETTCEDGFPNVEIANEEILIVSFFYDNMYHIFSTKKYGEFKPEKDNINSFTYDTEEEMLKGVIDFWSKHSFDIVSGWNSDFFDIPYLVNRIEKILGKDWVKKLSPWGLVKKITIPTLKGDLDSYEIVGVNHIDYLAAFKKFSLVQAENYKLDTIGNLELGMKKLDYSEFESMRELYRQDFQKFGNYNLRDNEILVGLEKKRKILELITSLALNSKVNLIDTFKQTVMWDSIFYNYLLERGIVVPKKERHSRDQAIPGGFVKDVKPGMYDWIMSFDLDSLYPHLMMQYNISPETMVNVNEVDIQDLIQEKQLEILHECHKNNLTLAGNGVTFTNKFRGFIPELMDVMYQERKAFKDKMLEVKKYLEANRESLSKEEIERLSNEVSRLNMYQNVRKIQLNSAYGSLAQVGFRFFMYELASAITLSGQLTIQFIEKRLNKILNKWFNTTDVDYLLAADTDSIHLDMHRLVDSFIQKKPDASKDEITDFLMKVANNKIQPELEKIFVDLREYMNAYEQKMRMKLENVVERGIYLAKKKYIYSVLDSEGVRYEKPSLKIMGLELVKSNTPAFCRKKMKEACNVIINKSQADIIKYIDETKAEFMALPFEDIAYPQGVNHISKYTDKSGHYVSGTQIYARGAIVYNKLLKQKGLEKKYESIGDGDKIKYCYLKMPNPIGENIISVPFALPKEFELHEFIDYETQFEKTFMNPVKRITDAVGWETEEKDSLESFFN